MAEPGITRFPVVEPGTRRPIGMVSLTDLLKAETLDLDAERRTNTQSRIASAREHVKRTSRAASTVTVARAVRAATGVLLARGRVRSPGSRTSFVLCRTRGA